MQTPAAFTISDSMTFLSRFALKIRVSAGQGEIMIDQNISSFQGYQKNAH